MEIILLIESILTVAVCLAAFLYLTATLYPRLILRPVWLGGRDPWITGDRGIRRMTFPEGRAAVYEPLPASRRYLRRYALIKQDGCTLLRCRIHERIAFIRYDVATFDARGRLLDVLTVSERITEAGHTRAVRLPRDTAYARVILRRADRVYEDHTLLVGYSYLRMGIFAGLCILTSVVSALVMRDSLAYLAELLLPRPVAGVGATLLTAAVAGALYAALVLQIHYIHAKKVMNA